MFFSAVSSSKFCVLQLGGRGFTLVRLAEMQNRDRQSHGGQCGEEAEAN